jgi:hypothetical protein
MISSRLSQKECLGCAQFKSIVDFSFEWSLRVYRHPPSPSQETAPRLPETKMSKGWLCATELR